MTRAQAKALAHFGDRDWIWESDSMTRQMAVKLEKLGWLVRNPTRRGTSICITDAGRAALSAHLELLEGVRISFERRPARRHAT